MAGHGNLFLAGLVFQAVIFGQAPSSTTISASPNPSDYGQPVTLTATVTAGATGKVTFYDGVTIMGVGAVSGAQASITNVMLPSGNRKLRAYYQGDGRYAASSSPSLPQTVVARKSLGLSAPVIYPGATAVAMAVGDFNGDHKQDLVMATSPTSSVTVYLGTDRKRRPLKLRDGIVEGQAAQPADFQTGVAYAVGNYPTSIAVADFNGDGSMDIVTENDLDGTVSVLLGKGDGTFQPAVTYAAGSNLRALAVGDFNGDGNADIAVVGVGTGVAILLGKGDGTFEHAAFLPFTGTAVIVSDFNGDGVADLAVASGRGAIGILLGNGDGTFQAPLVTTVLGASSSALATSDLNGDGIPDLLLSDLGYGVYVLLGNGDGTFTAPIAYNPGNAGAANVVVEDFNGDGKPDLAIVGYGHQPGLALLAGNGNGTFQAPVWYSTQDAFYVDPFFVCAVGDFNGDGKPDLAFASNATGISAFLVLFGGAGSNR